MNRPWGLSYPEAESMCTKSRVAHTQTPPDGAQSLCEQDPGASEGRTSPSRGTRAHVKPSIPRPPRAGARTPVRTCPHPHTGVHRGCQKRSQGLSGARTNGWPRTSSFNALNGSTSGHGATRRASRSRRTHQPVPTPLPWTGKRAPTYLAAGSGRPFHRRRVPETRLTRQLGRARFVCP